MHHYDFQIGDIVACQQSDTVEYARIRDINQEDKKASVRLLFEDKNKIFDGINLEQLCPIQPYKKILEYLGFKPDSTSEYAYGIQEELKDTLRVATLSKWTGEFNRPYFHQKVKISYENNIWKVEREIQYHGETKVCEPVSITWLHELQHLREENPLES